MKHAMNHSMKHSLIKISKTIIGAIAVMVSLAACRNDHCDDLMYAPMNIYFYSEIDTSETVNPYALILKGVGVDTVIDASDENMVQLALDNGQESCRFAVAVTSEHSPADTFYFSDDNYRIVGEGIDATYSSYEKIGDAYLFDGDFSTVRVFDKELEEGIYLMARPSVDTLLFTYTNRVEFVSAECGCFTSHRLKSVNFIHNGIGTVSVVDSIVTNLSDAKNIKIYLENY